MEERDALAARLTALEAEVSRLSATVDRIAGASVGVPPPVPAAHDVGAPLVPPSSSAAGQAARTTSRTRGEALLVRLMYGVGLFVLLVGAAIFLPAQLARMGPYARVLLGVTIGLAAILAGLRRPQRTWIGDGLVAFGAGVEYLSLWDAFHQALVPLSAAFAAMIATTAMLGALAYVGRNQRLALAGLSGGLLTPMLIATHVPNPLALNIYLLILVAAALALAVARDFRHLETAAFVAVLLYSPAWAYRWNLSGAWTSSWQETFSALYLVVFSAATIAAARRGTSDPLRCMLLSLQLAAFALALFLQQPDEAWNLQPLLLVFGAVALVAARTKSVPVPLRDVYSGWALGCAGLALLAAVTSSPSGVFAVEGAVLTAIASRGGAPWARLFAALSFLTSVATIGGPSIFGWSTVTPVLNERFVSCALLFAALWCAVESERAAVSPVTPWINVLRVALHATGLYAVVWEPYAAVQGSGTQNLVATFLLSAYAAALLAGGIRTQRALLRVLGVLAFFIAVCKIFAVDLAGVDALLRFLSFLALGVILVVAALAYQRAIGRRAEPAAGEAS